MKNNYISIEIKNNYISIEMKKKYLETLQMNISNIYFKQ